jgi:putative transposase
MQYRKQAHCTYHTRYHLVFVTKYRRMIFKGNLGLYVQSVMKNVTRTYPEIDILEMNTDMDHIHLLASIPPRMAVSEAVRLLKTNSSRALRNKFPWLRNMYEHDDLPIWSGGYFVSTVGADEKTIQRYIEMQGQEDKGQAMLAL